MYMSPDKPQQATTPPTSPTTRAKPGQGDLGRTIQGELGGAGHGDLGGAVQGDLGGAGNGDLGGAGHGTLEGRARVTLETTRLSKLRARPVRVGV